MRPDRIRGIVILGGGTAGWMAAAALSRTLGTTPDLRVTLVESDEIGTVGVGESTIPQILLFNAMLGLDEGRFVRDTGATFKLGIEFRDWTRVGERFFHPFGFFGHDMNGIEFHHHWLKGRFAGERAPLEDHSLNAVAARAGRFVHPRPDLPNSPLSRMGYAFQLDAGRYAALLRELAEGWGVERREGRVVRVARDGGSGHVTALHLADGCEVAGDLFVDCSGFGGLLIEREMGARFIDWTRWLPCDRAWAVPCATAGPSTPFTRADAHTAGWRWRIPLQHRVGNGIVYSGAHLGDDEAAAALLAGLDGAALGDPRPLRFRAGHRDRAWIGNVVALGLAGGFLEPLESTGIHLVQTAIARLLTLFPSRGFDPMEIARFNSGMAQEYADIRDLLVLHYRLNRRPEPFWRDAAAVEVPDGLAYKLAMFRANGRIIREHNEVFTETSWLAVMAGKGVEPAGYHPAADTLDDADTLARLADVRRVVGQVAAALPSQDEHLRRLGRLPEGVAA